MKQHRKTALRRLCSIYLIAMLALVVPMHTDLRYIILSISAVASIRRAFPVLIPAVSFFVGENIAVQHKGTWNYEQPATSLGLHVPTWLLPLSILAAQFCCDVADYDRLRNE